MTKQRQRIILWFLNTGFVICKEGPDDVNNFTKSFAHILLWVLLSVLHCEDCFSQILK